MHPSVEECIVAGIADEYRGQTVKAWIKLKNRDEAYKRRTFGLSQRQALANGNAKKGRISYDSFAENPYR